MPKKPIRHKEPSVPFDPLRVLNPSFVPASSLEAFIEGGIAQEIVLSSLAVLVGILILFEREAH